VNEWSREDLKNLAPLEEETVGKVNSGKVLLRSKAMTGLKRNENVRLPVGHARGRALT
jgi:hypothetical protein